MTELVTRSPNDLHVHVRQGEGLEHYVARSAEHFGHILVMPNTKPPVASAQDLVAYRNEIQKILDKHKLECKPLMSFKLLPGMGASTVRECLSAGAVCAKYYPAGATTNADDGPRHPSEVTVELDELERDGGILSIHAEAPDSPEFQRELDFLPVIEYILSRHPKLRIVIEHLSSAETVQAVLDWPERVGATITAHHLCYTVEDLVSAGIDTSLYCKPILKTKKDREALLAAASSGNPKFFFGSDSAPHPAGKKQCLPTPAGAYTAPVRLPLLASAFEAVDALNKLEFFVSTAGALWYNLPTSKQTIRLVKEPWTVPEILDGTIPCAHGHTLPWQVDKTAE